PRASATGIARASLPGPMKTGITHSAIKHEKTTETISQSASVAGWIEDSSICICSEYRTYSSPDFEPNWIAQHLQRVPRTVATRVHRVDSRLVLSGIQIRHDKAVSTPFAFGPPNSNDIRSRELSQLGSDKLAVDE